MSSSFFLEISFTFQFPSLISLGGQGIQQVHGLGQSLRLAGTDPIGQGFRLIPICRKEHTPLCALQRGVVGQKPPSASALEGRFPAFKLAIIRPKRMKTRSFMTLKYTNKSIKYIEKKYQC